MSVLSFLHFSAVFWLKNAAEVLYFWLVLLYCPLANGLTSITYKDFASF